MATPLSPRQWNMVGARREAGCLERRGQPATAPRCSEAFKLGIYTVDEKVPRCAWCRGDAGSTPCTRLVSDCDYLTVREFGG